MMASGLAAQTPPASPFVSADHWSHRLARRLDAAGRLPAGVDVARQGIPQEEIAALLGHVDSILGTHYLEAFRAEFKPPVDGKLTVTQSQGIIGYATETGRFAPGIGYDSIAWTGARALDDESDFIYGVEAGLAYAPFVAIGASSADPDVPNVQLVATAGYLGAWAGMRPIGYAVGNSGGLVLDAHAFPAFGVFLPRALHIPVVGPLRFEMHAGKIENVLNLSNTQREIEPWFWTARASFEPLNGRLRVGVSRGMMFGGEGNTPVTFARVAENIFGFYTERGESNFANQILGIDFRLQVPRVPLSVYLEWGSDDGAGALQDVPGIIGGLEYAYFTPAFDGAFGIEHVQFTRSCCGNSVWYRNAWFRGSWADDEDALGHPLGGHGREWRVFANGHVARRVDVHAAVFRRDRGAENIFAPAWEGKSTGVEAGAEAQISGPWRVVADGEVESGASDWTASRFRITLRGNF